MDFTFGFFDEMDSYEAWAELNAFHDMIDNLTLPTYDEVNEILSRLADEGIVELSESEMVS
jgi:hypothetical protein